MAQDILIKGSTVTATPATLLQKELAYSEVSDNLFIGTAAGVVKIGGKSDVDKLAGIEDLADVTSTATVSAAGAVLKTDTDVSTFQFVTSDLVDLVLQGNGAAKVPSAKAVTDAGFSHFHSNFISSSNGTDPIDGTTGSPYHNGTILRINGAGTYDLGGVGAPLVCNDKDMIIKTIDNGTGDITWRHWGSSDNSTVNKNQTDASSFGFVIDEDAMTSDSTTKVPTQQSVKAYVDSAVVGGMAYKGGYNAVTNTPNIADGTASLGDTYTVTDEGTFLGVLVHAGDVIIAEEAGAAVVADFTIVERSTDHSVFSLVASEGAASGIATLDANTEVVELPAGAAAATAGYVLSQDGTWVAQTAGTANASETVAGAIEIATQAEVDAGVSAVLAVTPATLAAVTIDGGTF